MRTVAEAMTTPAAVVDRSASIQAASADMLDAGTQAAIVVDDGRVCGLATASDVAAALAADYDIARTPIAVIAEGDPATVHPDDLLAEVRQRMRAEQRAIVAVVGADDEPIGLLEDPEAGAR
jgi:CBS domain-containing protein